MLFGLSMKVISWNVRRIRAPNKRCLVKSKIENSATYIVMLQETKFTEVEELQLFHKWKYVASTSLGALGGLSIMWIDVGI